ncbi:MAG: SET domain-containing protein-lysine N-methyltransferase [Burkholderiaceae bacterium]|nr:SET domain-containing protein-lysine N-methyltransferase [Burkholderiaceae bacterium]
MPKNYLKVRPSSIEGSGAFALRRIPKGTRIIEYTGERITSVLAQSRYGVDDRYEKDFDEEPHVYLFTVDDDTIIDGSVDGSDARFINHSCDPNCEAVIENRRIYIEALRKIEEGEELTFDYQLDIGSDVTDEDKQRYACCCGAANCRGTMLAPLKRK